MIIESARHSWQISLNSLFRQIINSPYLVDIIPRDCEQGGTMQNQCYPLGCYLFIEPFNMWNRTRHKQIKKNYWAGFNNVMGCWQVLFLQKRLWRFVASDCGCCWLLRLWASDTWNRCVSDTILNCAGLCIFFIAPRLLLVQFSFSNVQNHFLDTSGSNHFPL